jgi:hypothetical protein
MRAAKTDPTSTQLINAMSCFKTRNKAEEQTNSTSYQALSGRFFWKSLYTYKKLRNTPTARGPEELFFRCLRKVSLAHQCSAGVWYIVQEFGW